MKKKFPKNTFSKRIGSMFSVDFRSMFISPLFYIILGIAVGVPILILVMTTMMDGSVSVNPETGEETVIEAFDYAWQIIGSVSSSEASSEATVMSMDMMSMCNINLLYFGAAVLVCLFVSADFRSGYAKNLFAVRTKKSDYVISKTLVCFTGCALLVLGFFLGTIIGGAIAGLPFAADGVSTMNIVMCLFSKMFLMLVFVPIYVLTSIIGKQKTWLAMILSLAVGMLLFMMIPMLTPLNATFVNVIICLIGGIILSLALGAVSCLVLKKRDIL